MSAAAQRRGIALRLLAVFLMTTMSAAVHAAALSVPVGQIMFWRSAVALIPICLYAAWLGDFPAGLRTRRPRLHLTRSLFGAFSMAMSFLSLAYLPVANAQAIAYLAPVLTLPLAAVMLGERWPAAVPVSVALGFGGALLLLWEAIEAPGEGAWIGVLAAFAYALTMALVRVHIKRMTESETASAIAFYFALVSGAAGMATLPFGWAPLTGESLLWLILAGLFGGAGHIAASEAVARAPVGTLAPFEFTGLIWALGFDLILFAVLPGAAGWAGVLAITAAALLTTLAAGRR